MGIQKYTRWVVCVMTLLCGMAHSKSLAYEVIEDDILQLTRFSPVRALLIADKHHYWANGVVPFVWGEGLPMLNKQAALRAMDYWQRNTNITFVEVTEHNRNDYPDYIAFVPESGQLCASFVGRIGGRQEVFLSLRCDFRIILHELGHVLGLWHEQSRADRDQYIRIIWENIQKRAQYNFEKRVVEGEDYKSYDYHSIMHYGPYAFSKNGQQTIEPLTPGVIIGNQQTLSNGDLAAIYTMYPGPLG